jgi:RNA-directed DNA polymerase
VDELTSSGKPFVISKWEVWEAWEKVKANKGAPGVDDRSIEDFGTDLKNNLYRIWNRMSSGSYFPPPVLAVEIPKPHGKGTRVLGVPTVADRVAQTVVARRLEQEVEPIFHPDSYGYRPGRSALDAVAACRQRCWKTDWVIDLDIQQFFDSVPWDLIVKAVAAHTDQPWVVLYVTRWLARAAAATRRHLAAARPRYPTGVGGLARAGEPVFALCVGRLDGQGAPDRQVRTLASMTRWCTASANARPGCWSGRSPTGWPRSGCGCTRPRPGSCTARTANDGSPWRRRRSPSSGSRSAPAGRVAEGAISRRFCPRSATTPCARPARRCGPLRLHLRTGHTLTELAHTINPIVRGWMGVRRRVLQLRAASPPQAHQRRPAALAPQEGQAAARVQAGQALLGRHHPPRSQHVCPLAVEPRGLVTRATRAR